MGGKGRGLMGWRYQRLRRSGAASEGQNGDEDPENEQRGPKGEECGTFRHYFKTTFTMTSVTPAGGSGIRFPSMGCPSTVMVGFSPVIIFWDRSTVIL